MFYCEGKACSALLIAAARGNHDIAEILISNGASVHVVDGTGETPLHKASFWGHGNLVKLLIASGAQIDASSKNGYTPLYLAASHHHQEVAKLLLDYGAVTEPDIAVMLGDIDSINHYLIQGIDANSKLLRGAEKGDSWLMGVISSKNISLVELLLNYGAKANEKAELKKFYPLYRATALGCLDICKLLISHGADVNIIGEYGKTLLHLAAQRGYHDIIELLLDCGANVNALDLSKSSPLFGATQCHHLQATKSLLSRGAEVNLTDDQNMTPLLRAFQRVGNDEIVKLLVAYGANVNIRGCREELTPIHLAVAQNNKNLVEFLLENGAREGLN